MKRRYPLVAERAGYRCEYCHAPEELFNARFDVEHVLPKAHGGTDATDNLALSCEACNLYKGDAVDATDPDTREKSRLFNPRVDSWPVHFGIGEDDLVVGRTPVGRATVERLRLNANRQVHARAFWRRANRFP